MAYSASLEDFMSRPPQIDYQTQRYDDAVVEEDGDDATVVAGDRKERAPQPDLHPGEKLVRKFAVKSDCPAPVGTNVYSGGVGMDAGGWGGTCNMYGPAMREIGGGATQVNILWVSATVEKFSSLKKDPRSEVTQKIHAASQLNEN
jgi:hypothetical protein